MVLGRQDSEALVVRMLRLWRASRSVGENPRPHMQARLAPIGPSPELVPACDSLFMLTEAVLGRPLAAAGCFSAAFSDDEAAVLALLRHAPDCGTVRTGPAVPHGLPAALRWAAFAVLRALDDRVVNDAVVPATPERCPFRRGSLVRAA